MNYSVIFKMMAMSLVIMTAAFSACLGVGFYYESAFANEAEAIPSWICAIAFTALMAGAFYLPSRNAPKELYKKEAMCVIGLGWTLASLVGALPYALILHCPFPDALFESASGITTTGASVFTNLDEIPRSLMFWRCLSHWIGGMGVVVFFVALLSSLGSSGRVLYANETSAASGGGLETERIQTGILRIMWLYAVLSALCLTTFKICGMNWFDAVCHMFSTVSTGGFGVYNDSIAHFGSLKIEWAIIVFMFLSALSFPALILLMRGSVSKFLRNTEFWIYSALIVLSAAVVCAANIDAISGNPAKAITNSVFQTVSMSTTTGFVATNFGAWLPLAQTVFFCLLIIGGCSGSTAGGLKVSRVVTLFRLSFRAVEKSFRPNVVRPLHINGKTLDRDDAYAILTYVSIFCTVLFASVATLAVLEPHMKLGDILSSAMSIITNTGPRADAQNAFSGFENFSYASKTFLSLLMIMGRLEFFAILALFMPSLWRKFQ